MLSLLHKVPLLKFCKFKYYRELAGELNYPLSKINEELGYRGEDRCWLLGYRMKVPRIQLGDNAQVDEKEEKEKGEPPEVEAIVKDKKQVELQYDPLGREYLSFQDIQSFATKNNMDVCSADPQNKQVALVKLRESIYRRFYQAKLYKKNSTGKKHKEIRVPQNIQDHDIMTKVDNVRSLIKKGEFKFKIFTENDSKKSQKAIRKMCDFLGRAPDVKIQKFQLQQKSAKKRSIVIDRWTVHLDFSSQSKVDYQQINKKWRRHVIQQRVQKQKQQKQQKQKEKKNRQQGLENEPIELQRQALREMREMGVPLPSKFREYGMMEDMMDVSGRGFFFENLDKFHPNLKESMNKTRQAVNVTTGRKKKSPKASKQQEQSSSQSQSQQKQEESSSDLEQKSSPKSPQLSPANRMLQQMQLSQQQQKQLRKQMRARTIQDILEQMQSIRSNKTALDPYDSYQIKKLEGELKEVLRVGGSRGKV